MTMNLDKMPVDGYIAIDKCEMNLQCFRVSRNSRVKISCSYSRQIASIDSPLSCCRVTMTI